MVKTHIHTHANLECCEKCWNCMMIFFFLLLYMCGTHLHYSSGYTHIPSLFSLFWLLSRLSSMWCVFFWVWMSDSCFFRNVCFEWPPLRSLALSFWTLFSIYSVTKQRVSSGKLSRHLYAIVWGQSYAYRIVSACEKAKASSSLWCLFSFAAQL